MPVETPSLFAEVIKDHLALKEQNSTLDRHMPIDRYKAEDPFQNHPLFKTEEQARLEETMDGVQPDFVAHGVDTAPCPGPARRPRSPRRLPRLRSRTQASGPSTAPGTSTGATSRGRPRV